jgi:pimeloyl-ACP methyl ester carboxylesterase
MPETFVLITGAWHGGWCWRPVAQHLRALGHRVLTPTLPGLHDGDDPTGLHLSDVVDAVVELVDREDLRGLTLVGHSWGGYPITGAAHRLRGRLRKLVYWSAFVPARGRSLYDEIPPEYQKLFAELARASDDNTVALPLEVWQSAFLHDASEDVQRALHALMVPHPYQYFIETVEPLDAAAGIPAAYVLSSEDIALPPGEYGWNRFAERLGVEPVVAAGSHEACFTVPEGLAQALLKA